MVPENFYRVLLAATNEFDERRLWRRCSNSHYFAAELPGVADPMFGVVMGQAGEEFGLSVFRGPRALGQLMGLLDEPGPDDDALEDLDYISFSMVPFASLPPDARTVFRKAGQAVRASSRVPHFLAKSPGRQPRTPNDEELTQLLYVIRGVLQADRQGDFHPFDDDPQDGVLTLTLTGEPGAPQVSADILPYEVPEAPRTVLLSESHPALGDLPRLEGTWLVGLPTVPVGIEGDDHSVRVLLVADDASEFLLTAQPVLGQGIREAAEAVLGVFRGENAAKRKGLPRELRLNSKRLHEALAPVLGSVGVRCTYVPRIPKLEQIAGGLVKHIGGDLPPFSRYVSTPPGPADEGAPRRKEPVRSRPRETRAAPQAPSAPRSPGSYVPEPDDLAGWKEADRRLGERFRHQFDSEERLLSSRAANRYFRDDDLEYFFEEHEPQGVVQAYVEWAVLDYRPTRKSRTQAEKMLAKGLPEAEAILLRSRTEAHPSLYRVASHDSKAGTVTLEDVLLGGRQEVHDRLLSENIDDGLFIATRVFAAGKFRFIALAGPPLPPAWGMDAVEFLQDSGLELTREGLRREAHKLGWLWDWIEEQQADRRPTRLCNTDGEDLLWHTASFRVADETEVRSALGKRADIEYDQEDDEFTWIRDTSDDPKVPGDFLRLGRIEFVGDELVLTVNSAQRLAKARKWLEKIPGVAFQGVATRRWDEGEQDRPMDEKIAPREPEELTPEMIAAAREMITQQYMAWLDMPLPMLGGRSPRQMCQTEAGRKKVAMLIRTIPNPMGNAPVEVPRDQMLRELGLAP